MNGTSKQCSARPLTADRQAKSYAHVGAAASPRKSSQSTMRATEHHVGHVLTDDFGRMVILQRRCETLGRLAAEPDLLEERLNVIVLAQRRLG